MIGDRAAVCWCGQEVPNEKHHSKTQQEQERDAHE